MSSTLILSIVLITAALLFYSLGVWAERIVRYLKLWHVICFWIGFTFDVFGTWVMHNITEGPLDLSNPHTLTGQIAIWLMFLHALWATFVVKKRNEERLTQFHKFSLIVWLIWLIPYFSGVFLGMNS